MFVKPTFPVKRDPLETHLQYGAAIRKQLLNKTYWEKRELARTFFKEGSPCLLYRYVPFNIEKNLDLKKVRDTVVNSQFWMASRDQLNDPMDLTAEFVYAGTVQERRKRIEAMIVSGEPHLGWLQRRKKVDEVMSNQSRLYATGKKVLHDSLGKVGICCFTTNGKSGHMWTHYAEGHSGIAYIFDVAESLDFFSTVFSVIYTEIAPQYDWVNNPADIFSVLRNKGVVHSHEDEWRAIRMASSPPMEQFNPMALIGVILGHRFDGLQRKELRNILLERRALHGPGSDLRIFQAKTNGYSLRVSAENSADFYA